LGSFVDSASPSGSYFSTGQTVRLEGTLSAGQYVVVGYASSSQYGIYTSASYPYTSADVDITNGIYEFSGTWYTLSGSAFNFDSITALKAAAPSDPTNLSASVSGDDVSLTWDDVQNENGYYVYRSTSTGSSQSDYSKIATLNADDTDYNDTALADGEQYYYRVSAYNDTGESGLSNEVPPTTELPAPSGASITVNGDDDITISWTDNSDNENQFRVEVSEDGGAYSLVGTFGSGTTSINHAPATSVDTLQYRVRAETSHTSSTWTTTGTVDTNPGGLAVAGHGSTSVDLSWSGADQADGFEVYRAQASGSTRADYSSVRTTGGTRSFTDSSLENGERYYYRVAATYSGGTDSPLTGEVDQRTDLPAPSSVTLDTSAEDKITLSWTKADNSSDGTIEIYRSTDGSLGTEITGGLSPTATSYTDTGLSDGEQYYYTIRRVTDHTSSDATQQAAVALLPAPTNLTVDAVTDTTADLSWTDNHDNGETRVEYKPTSSSTWQTFSTVAIGTESETITGLRNGEEYDARVVATTEHDTTEDE